MADTEKPAPGTSPAAMKITQGRSPAYPYIPLGKAVDRLLKIVEAGVGRNAYPPETFYKLWDLGPLSSGARQTMAALNGFGLVDYDGRGEVRKVKISDLGVKIAFDKVPDSKDRLQALQLAALTPAIHTDLYQRFPYPLPADVVLLTYLTRDKGYNAAAAQSLIDEYKDTLTFAALDKPTAKADFGFKPPEEASFGAAKVGDLVMVEVNGAFVFPEAKLVEEIQEHDGESWVFVEGQTTAVKMEQVIVQAPVARETRQAVAPTRKRPLDDDEVLPAGWVEERLIDDGGDEIKIRYRGKASVARYEFIRDYLEFKINRLKPKAEPTYANQSTVIGTGED